MRPENAQQSLDGWMDGPITKTYFGLSVLCVRLGGEGGQGEWLLTCNYRENTGDRDTTVTETLLVTDTL